MPNSTITIKSCTCRHTYQDTKYGKQQRVFNQCKNTNGGTIRCTVCSKKQ